MLNVLIILFLLVFIVLARQALVSLAIVIVMAYIMDPYVSWLSRRLRLFRAGRLLCVLTAFLSVFAAAAGLIWGFADIIAGEISAGSLQDAIKALRAYYMEYRDVLVPIFGTGADFLLPFAPVPGFSSAPGTPGAEGMVNGSAEGAFSFITSSLCSALPSRLPKILQNLGVGTAKFFIGIVCSIYLLKDKEFFLCLVSKGFHLFLPQKVHGMVREILFDIHEVISAFLRGVFIDSVIVAFLSSLALSVLKIDFAVFIGCFAGLANIIPYFGPVLGIVPAAFAGLTAGGIPRAAAAALALFAVQQIECNFIYPRIIGKSIGLHPLFVLAAVSIAGFFGGLLWMILAVPIAGIIKVLITKWAESQ